MDGHQSEEFNPPYTPPSYQSNPLLEQFSDINFNQEPPVQQPIPEEQ